MDGEDQATQDARVESLWRSLDTRNEGQLNLNGLKKGLGKIDHRPCIPLRARMISDDRFSSQERGFPPLRRHESCGCQWRWSHIILRYVSTPCQHQPNLND